MDELQVPAGLRDKEQTDYTIQGPFKLTHNDAVSYGLWLYYNGENYVLSDPYRSYRIDDTYTVTTAPNTIIFYSEQWGSKFVINPLTQADVKWLTPDEPEADINDLKELILDGQRTYNN